MQCEHNNPLWCHQNDGGSRYDCHQTLMLFVCGVNDPTTGCTIYVWAKEASVVLDSTLSVVKEDVNMTSDSIDCCHITIGAAFGLEGKQHYMSWNSTNWKLIECNWCSPICMKTALFQWWCVSQFHCTMYSDNKVFYSILFYWSLKMFCSWSVLV